MLKSRRDSAVTLSCCQVGLEWGKDKAFFHARALSLCLSHTHTHAHTHTHSHTQSESARLPFRVAPSEHTSQSVQTKS